MKEVSIIIPTLNEAGTIEKLIDGLSKEPYPAQEILVVDGGSDDGTVEIVSSRGVEVIQETGKEKCPANARNLGARNTNAEVLCFLDGDTEHVNECFINKAMEHFERDDVIGVRCKREIIEDSLVEKVTRSLRNSKLIKFLEKKESKGYAYANFLRREVFEGIGGFPLLGYGEDRIFWKKLKDYLRKNRGEIVQEPASIFFQHRPHTFKELFSQSEWYGRTAIPYIKKCSPSLMEILSIFAPLSYVISAFLTSLIVVHPLFLILAMPFLARVALAISLVRSKYGLLIPLTSLVRGCGFMRGICSYFLEGKRLGR